MDNTKDDTEAVATQKIKNQCAHYGGIPTRCLMNEREWPSYIVPKRCALCPEGRRRARPATGLSDDARKIVEALEDCQTTIEVLRDIPLNDATIIIANNSLRFIEASFPLAESLPGKIEALEVERDNAIKSKEMTEKFLGGSLYSARMALQRRAEAAEAQLAAVTKERDEAVADRAVDLTVGNGLLVYGSAEAIMRAQTYVLLDSKHPQETKDTNRLLARALQAAESQLAERTIERDAATLSLAARDAEIKRLRQLISEFSCNEEGRCFSAEASREIEKINVEMIAEGHAKRRAALAASVAEKEEE
jgi:hypothetical protein